MCGTRMSGKPIVCLLVATFLCSCSVAKSPGQELLTAAGKPAEGPLDVFLREPLFDMQVVFDGGNDVREPYLAIAVDGTLLAVRNYKNQLRRSEDGGRTWGDTIDVPIAHSDSNMIVDENAGDIMSVRMWDGTDKLFRSKDHGKTWTEEETVIQPNELMKQLENTGAKKRVTKGEQDKSGTYYLHANAGEAGVALRHGQHKGRLLVSATFRPHAKAHPSDREPADAIFSCALFSDDGGATWQVSDFFPEGYTEEAALVELHDGRIYYNSRSHSGYYDKAFARELRPDENVRREAWSNDGGQTWENLNIVHVLPDGGGYGRGYGMKGGLTRLPVKGRDVLIYSNADTAGGDRKKMTVWASFDGAETWPVKRLVYAPHGAYSSLVAGRPGTASEGLIYLFFEGGPNGAYTAMQVARFSLSWILAGERTGNGDVPEWVLR
ncbi:MAG: exo-alpha-sialidase [Planctomycetes bacterium]|nr:exo-alpha-sialidase [Planctomycetota bacterium]